MRKTKRLRALSFSKSQLDICMASIAFIFHGGIKNRDSVQAEIVKVFKGLNVKFYATEKAGQSVDLAEQAVKVGYTHIICVGGDGSLNEVVNGAMNALPGLEENRRAALRLGVLPMGSGNDFVKTMKSPTDIEGLKSAIAKDSFKTIDLGHVEYHTKAREKKYRYYINITDVGMGGVVAEKLSRYGKWMGAQLTYQRAILSTLISYKHKPIKVTADSFTYQGNIMNFIVANGKYFGSGLGIAPEAEVNDGELSVVILGEISLLDYIKNLGDVRKCVKIKHPELQYKSTKAVFVESNEPLAIDMDGEFIGYSPMRVKVVPAALRFIC